MNPPDLVPSAPSPPGGPRRGRAAGLALSLIAAVGVLAGCGPRGITAVGLEDALAPTFAHLYVLQQHTLGQPTVPAAALAARADCDTGRPAGPDTGAGNGWRCVVSWRVAGIDTPARAIYRVQVDPSGRYIADGDGPREVNGRRVLTTGDPAGETGGEVLNPLWQFDGVLDTT